MVVASTGFFDGVHSGHQAVIRTLLERASECGGQSLVISFWPHPRVILQNGAKDLRLLTSIDEKKELLYGMGVDRVEVLPFTREFASLDAEDYLKMLREKFGVTSIVLGYDNRFGSGSLATSQIQEIASRLGIESVVVPPLVVDSLTVSSTQIRRLLGEGNVELASEMLGRDYSVQGVVVSGKQLGRTIGFPTANLALREPLKCVPAVGVYLSRVRLGEESFWGMSNVDRSGLIETHIFDFDADIYGHDLEVSFVAKIRDEVLFSSFEELKKQLKKDEMSAKSLIFA